ncbi:hypothetical protein BCIN_03g05950 [Botrytis cinerea B05.10]|uniref:Mitochondrial import inner membrane translocase subunit TIM50 n=1 Tax=Botryotinia fuckeliana (strain B05.10) TaxID=332648 RepID=A0A384JD06_BOTFB|nr:hypothetical protein BCIN_03g05950 [Botrytis cinerea B05.10]ATZ48370.1 hypothetical protein BCIN_03g05950 [Botrytis cinerea B05.10]
MSLARSFVSTLSAVELRYITARKFSSTNNVLNQLGRNDSEQTPSSKPRFGERNRKHPGVPFRSGDERKSDRVPKFGDKKTPLLNHSGLKDIPTNISKPLYPLLRSPYFASKPDPLQSQAFFYPSFIKHLGEKKPSTKEKMAPMSKDARTQPSRASGGVPNPTSDYLEKSYTKPDQAPVPSPLARHLLVVIDLNGTLLYRPNRKSPTKFTARPHAEKFLQYCIDTFSVVIWSSARSQNVIPMCKTILTPKLRQNIIAIWGRETFGLSSMDYNTRVQCYKRLTKLWNDPQIAASHPDAQNGGRWDQTNTVLIDDSSEKARSEPFNLIEIPEFFGDNKEVGDVLPQVHDYLNFLSMHENVSAAIRHSPFVPQPKADPREATGLNLPIHPPKALGPARVPSPVEPVYQPSYSSDTVPSKYQPMLGNSEKW